MNIWFGTVCIGLELGELEKWGDEEEKLYVFLRRGYQRFSRVLGAVKKPFELNSCAVSNTPFCAVEVVN